MFFCRNPYCPALIALRREFLFISGEQLSLNVAGDSANTLSVLVNMGGVLDDCGLRFVQMRRRPPQNTPDFGVQRIFRNITGKGPRWRSIILGPIWPPFENLLGYTPRSFEREKKVH